MVQPQTDQDAENVAAMNLPFDDMLAVTSITFFVAADVKCDLYEINKNNRANATHGPKNVPRPKRSDVGPESSRTRTWTGTNATVITKKMMMVDVEVSRYR